MVQDQVDLLGQLLVQLGDDRLDGLDDVRANQRGLRERLLRQGPNGPFNRFLGLVGLRLEFFSQERIELSDLERSTFGLRILLGFRVCHFVSPVGGSGDLRRGLVLCVFRRRERFQQGRVR